MGYVIEDDSFLIIVGFVLIFTFQSAFTASFYNASYATHLQSSVPYTPPTQYSTASATPSSLTSEPAVTAFSPISEYSHASDLEHCHQPVSHPELQSSTDATVDLLSTDPQQPTRPRSSPSTFAPNPSVTGSLDYAWSMNPLGISTPNMQQQPFYSTASYPPLRSNSPRMSDPTLDPGADLAAPQPRRMYAPIAPQPFGAPMAMQKRPRDDDELSEQAKRRKRSDSTMTAPLELSDEDKLLLQLKDDESMPWKDIAARFQTDMGKTYQIPALQMRLKRLRERMRVWTEADLKALRMAHEFWVQSKFEIISQKVSKIVLASSI